MRKSYHILYLLLAFSLIACSPREVRTAQAVVRTADSLRACEQMYDDSLSLAQAYETLGRISRYLLPITNHQLQITSTYAHACYHYGRLLREKEDPVTAMQVFINATHSRTHDYHILGRIYSNMGDLCHLANEFQLAYDMYERSADAYLHNGDTLLYYYDLNNMAFELAEQKRKDDALTIIRQIKENCTDYNVLTKTLETRAEACLNVQQYDSVVYYSHLLCSRGNSEPTTFLLRAKAYSMMGCKDSSVYYAQYVLSISNELFDHNSALYILTHNDDSKDREDVRQISADRSDVQKLIEIHQGKLSQAAQLLEQDLNRKPDLRWLFAIAATLLIIGTGSGLYIYNRRKKHQLLSQKLGELQSATSNILVKHQELTELYNSNHTRIKEEINQTCVLLLRNKNLQKEIAWQDFEEMCKIIDSHFYLLASKLRSLQVLNETEIRLCILVLIGLNRAQIADILPYARNSVGKLKDHTAKSLGTTGKNLHEFLLDLAIKG